jgi:hypothetical protein
MTTQEVLEVAKRIQHAQSLLGDIENTLEPMRIAIDRGDVKDVEQIGVLMLENMEAVLRELGVDRQKVTASMDSEENEVLG